MSGIAFLTGRIVSLVLYCSLTLFLYLGIRYGKKEDTKYYYAIFSGFLIVFAYFFVPTEYLDLYNLWKDVERFSEMSVSQTINHFFHAEGANLGFLYIALLSRVNKHLVPAISALIVLRNYFSAIYELQRTNQCFSRDFASLAVFFYLSTGQYAATISGIRSGISFSILFLCFFREIYQNKPMWRNLIWYIVASLFHSVGIVVIAVRLGVEVVFANVNAKVALLFLLGIILFIFLSSSFGATVYEKAVFYLQEEQSPYLRWAVLSRTLSNTVIFIVLIMTIKRIADPCDRKNAILLLCFLLCAILCYVSHTIYVRFSAFTSCFASLYISRLNNEITADRTMKIKYTILFLSVITLGVECIRGDLNFLTFFPI